MSFEQLHLSKNLLKAIYASNYTEPTPIQKNVIPLIIEGKDIIAQSQTGSGKTAAFVFPILEKLYMTKGEGKAKLQVVVLTPTRELALQVSSSFEDFGRFLDKELKVVSVIGGESLGDQIFKIQKGCDILVATSGRFIDLLSKKQTNFSYLRFFVLDEADKMLDLGFAEELESVLSALPDKRQNLLFSATYPQKMQQIAAIITKDATEVNLAVKEQVVEGIHQRVILTNKEKRAPLLRHLLKQGNWESVLVFMANKRATDNLAAKFRKHGFNAASFNADLDQEIRNDTLAAFKEHKVEILFATDIASRGLDIKDVALVVNYDLPRSPADYIHRIGRTAREGKSGEAISFIDYESMAHFKVIEKRSAIKLQRESIKGYEIEGKAAKKEKGAAPVKGKRKSKKDKLREAEAKALSTHPKHSQQ